MIKSIQDINIYPTQEEKKEPKKPIRITADMTASLEEFLKQTREVSANRPHTTHNYRIK